MALTLAEIRAAELAWVVRGRAAGVRSGDTGWVPYSVDSFRSLLRVALRYAPGRRFLDAGCGIGTKCLLAAEAGCAAEGVERVPEYAAQARAYGVTVHECDLADFTGWPDYGIVYVNHPLFDDTREAAFEQLVQQRMAPGAVLIKVHTRWPPPPRAWTAALHERSMRRGIWVKEGPATTP
jgi:SAM-dependent methyltransferase